MRNNTKFVKRWNISKFEPVEASLLGVYRPILSCQVQKNVQEAAWPTFENKNSAFLVVACTTSSTGIPLI